MGGTSPRRLCFGPNVATPNHGKRQWGRDQLGSSVYNGCPMLKDQDSEALDAEPATNGRIDLRDD
jgi:hypothetical protein